MLNFMLNFMIKNINKFLYLLLIKMLKSIINYVNHNYQLCENIDSPFLSSDINSNECFIKSCLVYKNLHEIYGHGNISLQEVMMIMDVTDFLFIINSPVLKNHLIFHHALKLFGNDIKKENLRYTFLIQQSDHRVWDL